MASIVSGANIVEAWLSGSRAVSDAGSHTISNLITEIENPTTIDKSWFARFDPKSVGGADRLSVVAKVLFPGGPRRAGESRKDYLDRHDALLSRGLKSKRLHSSWGGTYFQRLRSLDGSTDQIERAIRALRVWPVRAETAI